MLRTPGLDAQPRRDVPGAPAGPRGRAPERAAGPSSPSAPDASPSQVDTPPALALRRQTQSARTARHARRDVCVARDPERAAGRARGALRVRRAQPREISSGTVFTVVRVVARGGRFPLSERSTRVPGDESARQLPLGEPVQQEPQRVRLAAAARERTALASGPQRAGLGAAPGAPRAAGASAGRKRPALRMAAPARRSARRRLPRRRRGGREVGVDGGLGRFARPSETGSAPPPPQRVREGVVPNVLSNARGGLGPGKQTPQRAPRPRRRSPGSAVFGAALGVQEAHHLHVRRGRVRWGRGTPGANAAPPPGPASAARRPASIGQRAEALASVAFLERLAAAASRRRRRLGTGGPASRAFSLEADAAVLETAAASAAAAGDERDQRLHRERARLRAPQQLEEQVGAATPSAPAPSDAPPSSAEDGKESVATRAAKRAPSDSFPHPRRARSKLGDVARPSSGSKSSSTEASAAAAAPPGPTPELRPRRRAPLRGRLRAARRPRRARRPVAQARRRRRQRCRRRGLRGARDQRVQDRQHFGRAPARFAGGNPERASACPPCHPRRARPRAKAPKFGRAPNAGRRGGGAPGPAGASSSSSRRHASAARSASRTARGSSRHSSARRNEQTCARSSGRPRTARGQLPRSLPLRSRGSGR